MQRTRFLVVWGLSETIDTFSPSRAFTIEDFPTFGLPTSVTKPHRCPVAGLSSSRLGMIALAFKAETQWQEVR